MSWEITLDQYGLLIEGGLRGFVNGLVEDATGYHPFVAKVYSSLEEFVLRKGKRLASCSTLLTYKGYTNNIDERILRFSVGIELYRHCILVHDDLVDGDELRRGEKTLHKIFSVEGDERFGEGGHAIQRNSARS